MTHILKQTSILAASTAVLLLSACSATTSGVANTVKSQAKSSVVKSVTSTPTSSVALQPNQVGDASLTCDQLKMEIGSVDALLAQANTDSQESRAGNVGNQASNAAVRYGVAKSGAANVLGKVPFGMKMFNSALNSRAKAAEKKRVEAQNTAQNAAVRRSSLMGIYTGKGCS